MQGVSWVKAEGESPIAIAPAVSRWTRSVTTSRRTPSGVIS